MKEKILVGLIGSKSGGLMIKSAFEFDNRLTLEGESLEYKSGENMPSNQPLKLSYYDFYFF